MNILYRLNKCGKLDIVDLRDYPVNGIHQHHMILANYCKGRGASEEEALDLLYGKYKQKPQRRGLNSREIENAVTKAYSSSNRLSYDGLRGISHISPMFEKTSDESFWNTRMPLPNVEVNRSAIQRAIRETPWNMLEMHESAQLNVSECNSMEIIQLLFEPHELICSGTVKSFKTLTTKDWLSHQLGDQIVPNPSRVRVGHNMTGNPSAHCRDATGRRKYLIVESDDEKLSLDEKASVLRFLQMVVGAELAMVVYSGGKSLHGWFRSSGNQQTDWEFMKLACKLGADPRMWLPEQLARTPNAIRSKTQTVQKCLYIDPR